MINSDLHCHISLKPANNYGYNGDEGDIWKNRLIKRSKLIKLFIKSKAHAQSQSNLEKCDDGNVRLVFPTVYALERPFFDVNPIANSILFGINLVSAGFLRSNKYNILSKVIGIPEEFVRLKAKENKTGVNYFKDYLKEIETLSDTSNQTSKNANYSEKKFFLAKDYEHYKSLILNPDNIVEILNVEGAHTFGNYNFAKPFKKSVLKSIKSNGFENDPRTLGLLDSIKENILEHVKKQDTKEKIPFYVTFSHHFNNLLAGHAPALFKTLRKVLNQSIFEEEGFTHIGREVLSLLLARDNGRRILIDVKHMSVKSRIEYYNQLSDKYVNEKIPIINSHAAVNGIKTLTEAKQIDVKKSFKLYKKSFFGKGTISMTDEDIEKTFISRGLIGVCLHEGRMPGKKFEKEKKRILRSYKRKKINQTQKEKLIDSLFMKLFWSNILHIVKIQYQVIVKFSDKDNSNISYDPWEGITLGSDYDGIVDAFDNVKTAREYPQLRQDMIDYLSNPDTAQIEILDLYTEKKVSFEEIKNLVELNGKTINDRVQQIMFDNVDKFLKYYFSDNYLIGGQPNY